jgi:hypothetical protein
MSMRVREKTHPNLYPRWRRKESPARRCKIRDGLKGVICGIEDRTLIYDEDGKPHHFLYLYAAHLCPLDPWYERIEPIEGQRLRAMCPKHAREYDVYWKRRWEEVEHQRRLHRILLARWCGDNAWFMEWLIIVTRERAHAIR